MPTRVCTNTHVRSRVDRLTVEMQEWVGGHDGTLGWYLGRGWRALKGKGRPCTKATRQALECVVRFVRDMEGVIGEV